MLCPLQSGKRHLIYTGRNSDPAAEYLRFGAATLGHCDWCLSSAQPKLGHPIDSAHETQAFRRCLSSRDETQTPLSNV
eukprot:7924512-Pyramimonas_sp.AAC.1